MSIGFRVFIHIVLRPFVHSAVAQACHALMRVTSCAIITRNACSPSGFNADVALLSFGLIKRGVAASTGCINSLGGCARVGTGTATSTACNGFRGSLPSEQPERNAMHKMSRPIQYISCARNAKRQLSFSRCPAMCLSLHNPWLLVCRLLKDSMHAGLRHLHAPEMPLLCHQAFRWPDFAAVVLP